MSVVERAWTRCFVDLDVACPPPCMFEEFCARYSEPHRAYHTLRHIEECVAWFDHARELASKPGEVGLALLYHDAVYDPRARDNEEQSAELALDLCGDDFQQDSRIESLILATKHAALPRSRDEQLLVDIDLSILGTPRDRFDEYERQVRKEYDWVEERAFRSGRRAILESFLMRPQLFATTLFRERLEDAARANLRRSIAQLKD